MDTHSNERVRLNNLTKAAIVTALYVVITFAIAPLSYGMIQFRVSEMFNHLVFYNKRYLWAVTLGVFIANAYSFGAIDMVVGSLATLIFLNLSLLVTKKVKKMWKKQLIASCLMAASMFVIATELKVLGIEQHGFWIVFLSMAVGEFLSMFFGGFVIRFIASQINLTK